MKDQVTSIEQSKRLIELGVPAEKASMVWIPGYEFDALTRRFIPNDKECFLSISYDRSSLKGDGVIPAFTVADLLGVMPTDIPAVVGQNHDYALTLSNNFCWNLRYENSHMHQCIGEQLEFDLVDLLCNRIEWILSNGYELNL